MYPRTAPGNANNADVDEGNEYFAINSERNITTDTPTNNIPDIPEFEDSDSEELTMDDFRNRRRFDISLDIENIDIMVFSVSGKMCYPMNDH